MTPGGRNNTKGRKKKPRVPVGAQRRRTGVKVLSFNKQPQTSFRQMNKEEGGNRPDSTESGAKKMEYMVFKSYSWGAA